MRWFTESEGSIAGPHIASGNGRRTVLEARFARIVSADAAALSRLAATYTITATDREDLLQDIALAFWRALPTFRGECSERSFLFRIAHNRGIRYLSRKHRFASLEGEQVDVEDPHPGAEAMLAEEQDSERLLRAMRSLPLIYREVLSLALEDLSYAEIAQVLAIGDSNVGVRINRARQLLRERLESLK